MKYTYRQSDEYPINEDATLYEVDSDFTLFMWVAEDAALDYYNNHAGCCWPRYIEVSTRFERATYLVDMEMKPDFYVAEKMSDE